MLAMQWRSRKHSLELCGFCEMDEVLCPVTGCDERALVDIAVCVWSGRDVLALVVQLRMALLVGEGWRTCDWRRQGSEGLSGGVLGSNGMVVVVEVEV